MLPLLLTGLAGLALGIVIMRLLQAQHTTPPAPEAESEAAAAPPTTLEASAQQQSKPRRPDATKLAYGGAAALGCIALATYALRTPQGAAVDPAGAAQVEGAAGAAANGGKALDDVDTAISKLATKLEKDPTNGEGFRFLGWSYLNTGKAAEAKSAYLKAVALLPKRADVHAGLGEALVLLAGDKVGADAKAEFDTALRLDPKEPRARYFNALFQSQNGAERQALDAWIDLSNSSAADLPWQADLQTRITALGTKLGIDSASRLKVKVATPSAAAPAVAPAVTSGGPDAATVAAASALPPAQQDSMINGMVDGLAAKLKANPNDLEGWGKLIRSRMVLKEEAKARADLATARKAFASDPVKSSMLDGLAKDLGL
jgi:cytochrome c-type biogenesis protein CcmH